MGSNPAERANFAKPTDSDSVNPPIDDGFVESMTDAAHDDRAKPHLKVVAQRLKRRCGHVSFHIDAEKRDLAASAWSLDGLAPNPREGRPRNDSSDG